MNPKPPQLRNFGSDCYLNSGIQALSSCLHFIKEIDDLHNLNKNLEKLNVFNGLMKCMSEGGDTQSITTNYIFAEWNKSGQQDSFELLAHVINQVFDEIRKDKEAKREIKKGDITRWLDVKLPLRMKMEYSINCECGNIEKSPLQSDIALHLSFPCQDRYNTRAFEYSFKRSSKFDMNKMLDKHFQPEDIQDFECGKTGCTHKNAKRRLRLLWPPPNTICFHLQRLYWNNWKMEKINDVVVFCNRVTLKSSYFKDEDDEILDTHYYLKSVIVHYGGESCGHYTCYKKYKDQWYYTSDTLIRSQTVKEVFGCNPYIFFYERCEGDEIVPTIIEDSKINTFVHGIASCLLLMKTLSNSICNEFIKILNYLIEFSNGNCTRNSELENSEVLTKFKDNKNVLKADILFTILKDSMISHNACLLVLQELDTKKCTRCVNNSNSIYIDKSLIKRADVNLEQLLDDSKTRIDQKTDTLCIVLHSCSYNYWSVIKKKLFLSEKISLIKSIHVNNTKEYYLKSIVKSDACIRYIGGRWYEISNYDIKLCDISKLLCDSNDTILFYDTIANKQSSFPSPNPKRLDNMGPSEQFLKIPSSQYISVTPPIFISIDKYLNCLIQAISSCIIFIVNLSKNPSGSNTDLKHLMYLIDISKGIQETDHEINYYVQNNWCNKANTFVDLMNNIFIKIFENNNDKYKNSKSMISQYISCGTHPEHIIEDPSWYISLTVNESQTNIQKLFDEFFHDKEMGSKSFCNKCHKKTLFLLTKLTMPLSQTICIRLDMRSYYSIQLLLSLIVQNSYWMTSSSDGYETYDLKSFTTHDDTCCYRKINEEWYKVTNCSSDKVEQSSIFQVQPSMLFYESDKYVLFAKYVRCINQCLQSCKTFHNWLNVVKIDFDLITQNYVDTILDDIYQFLKTILEDLVKEAKKGSEKSEHFPMVINYAIKYGHREIKAIDAKTMLILKLNHLKDYHSVQSLLDQYFSNRTSLNQFTMLMEPFPKLLYIHLNIEGEDNTEIKNAKYDTINLTFYNSKGQAQQHSYSMQSGIECYGGSAKDKYAYFTKCENEWTYINNNKSKTVSLNEILDLKPYIMFYEINEREIEAPSNEIKIPDADVDLKFFNMLHSLCACSNFLKNLKSKIKKNVANSLWFINFIEQLNSNDWNLDRACDVSKLEGLFKKASSDYMSSFGEIMAYIFDCPGVDKEHNSIKIRAPIIIMNFGYTEEQFSGCININDLSFTGKITVQQFVDDFLTFYFNIGCSTSVIQQVKYQHSKKDIVEIFKGNLPETIGFLQKNSRLLNSMEITLKNQLCSKGSDTESSIESQQCCDSGKCCRKYRLKSVIDTADHCYKLCNEQWHKITKSYQFNVNEKEHVLKLDWTILLYELI